MKKTNEDEKATTKTSPDQPITKETAVLRIPKPNMQIVVLGLVAFITLFQTMQLVKISAQSSNAQIKAAPSTSTTTGTGAGSSADVPQSMVGGC